jgi:hypothetical protein
LARLFFVVAHALLLPLLLRRCSRWMRRRFGRGFGRMIRHPTVRLAVLDLVFSLCFCSSASRLAELFLVRVS